MLAHVHIMKTAGQTLCDILRQSFPGRHCDIRGASIAAEDLRFARKFYPRLMSFAGHGVKPYADLDSASSPVRYFTFVREPIARCISHYQFMVQKAGLKKDFDTWLRATSGNYQTRFLAKSQDAQTAIEMLNSRIGFVGLVERFNESLVLLKRWAEEPRLNIRYRSRNIAKNNRIKQQILSDPATLMEIQLRNEEDIKLYRYARNEIYPRQVAEYGPQLSEDVRSFEASLPASRRISLSLTLASAKRNLLYKPAAKLHRRKTTLRPTTSYPCLTTNHRAS